MLYSSSVILKISIPSLEPKQTSETCNSTMSFMFKPAEIKSICTDIQMGNYWLKRLTQKQRKQLNGQSCYSETHKANFYPALNPLDQCVIITYAYYTLKTVTHSFMPLKKRKDRLQITSVSLQSSTDCKGLVMQSGRPKSWQSLCCYTDRPLCCLESL